MTCAPAAPAARRTARTASQSSSCRSVALVVALAASAGGVGGCGGGGGFGCAGSTAEDALAPIADGADGWRLVPTTTGGRGVSFPNPPLVTHAGERVRFYDDVVRGRSVLVHFAYTRCRGSCPGTTRNLLRVLALLEERGERPWLVTVSLDGEGDTPEAMRRYRELHGPHPRWMFLSGAEDDLEAVRQRLGITDPDPAIDADRTQHAGLVLFGNETTGRWAAAPGQARAEVIADSVARVARAARTDRR